MKRIIISLLALAVITAMSIAAIAENIDFTNGTTGETEANEVTENTDDENEASEDAAETSEDNSALESAEEAYRAAKLAERLSEYEAELKSMVEAGTLTQEQADLLLENAKEKISLKNGECPNCGYDFGDSATGRGGHGMKDNGGFGYGRRH